MAEASLMQVKDTTANPAPLGLFGFGMTTVLLNLHNAGLYKLNTMVLAMGLCYGGTAQVIAGIMEYKKNNTFGTTAFISYGFFWLSLVALILLPKSDALGGPDDNAWASYLGIWGLFTLGLFVGTLRLNCALQVVFGSLVVLFFLLASEHAFKLSPGGGFAEITGVEGIFCGLSAMYTGLAVVLNEVYGSTVLPLGVVKKG
jgi:succinate-acetate transporter protein